MGNVKRTVKMGAAAGFHATQRASFVVTEGAKTGATFPLEAERITLGRSEEASIHLDDEQLSRFHAIVALGDEGYEVKDLHSTNGTCVNGHRVEGAVLLQHGDHVKIGKTTLRYLIEKRTDDDLRVYILDQPGT